MIKLHLKLNNAAGRLKTIIFAIDTIIYILRISRMKKNA